MDSNVYFNTDYFLLELQRAGVIDNKNNSELLSLEKVPNITIGLVTAVKSLKRFENHAILSWIRKGRKVTPLVEEQFVLYDKLSIYLQNHVSSQEDIQEWKHILNESKYIFPEDGQSGWSKIFGNTPNLLENVDPDIISIENAVQLPRKSVEREDEDIKENDIEKNNSEDEYCELKEKKSEGFFSHKYFLSFLQEVGAVISNDTERDISKNLVKVPNISIGLVLAAKSINIFTDQEILTWIRKGRKLTPLIEEQFLLYKKLSDYLMDNVDINDIEKWKLLFGCKYVFPSSDKEGWSLIFGELPELCQKVDEEQKSFKQLEVESLIEEANEVNGSCMQLETSKIASSKTYESFKELEFTKKEIDKEKTFYNPLENSKAEDTVKIFNVESEVTKCLINNPVVSTDEIAEGETKRDENETMEVSTAAHTDIEKDENIYDKLDLEMTVNKTEYNEIINESLSEVEKSAFSESNSDQNSCIDESDLSSNKAGLPDKDYSSDQIKSIEKTNEITNISGNDFSSPEFCKNNISQSENDDSSDWDDELEDLFNAVGEELTAAENYEKAHLESTNIKKVNHEHSTGSLTKSEMDSNNENNRKITDNISGCIENSANTDKHVTKEFHKGFTRDYFFSIIEKHGLSTDVWKHKKLTSDANITLGLLCSIKAVDLFTNQEIFLWIKKCCKLQRKMRFHDYVKLASYRELANYLMNEVDFKDEVKWKKILHFSHYKDYTAQSESLELNLLQSYQWKVVFGFRDTPPICDTVKIKFNHKYYFSQLLGYDAIKWDIKDGILKSYLVKIDEQQCFTVGLVLAAKAVGIFSDSEIISWISVCQNLPTIDSEKIHEQLAIYKEFCNYLENDADERDYEHVRNVLFRTPFKQKKEDVGMDLGWRDYFATNLYLHKRFKSFKCSYDHLSFSKTLGSAEEIDPVCSDPYEDFEVCKVWYDLFPVDTDIVPEEHFEDKPFHSNYFKELLIDSNITLKELIKVEKITVGLVLAAIHEKFTRSDINFWIQTYIGTKQERRSQLCMYKLLLDHLLDLKCNIEGSYWKRLINSVEYQVPVNNFDVWSNIFGPKIPNLLGVALNGKFEFERWYHGITYSDPWDLHDYYKFFQSANFIQLLPCGTLEEKQNLIFDKEYFASLLTECGALSESSRILKCVKDLTIGQVMAAVIDDTLNDKDIHEWIKQSEKDPCTKKTLEILDLKVQFFAYRLLASHLLNYQSENPHDSYLTSWRTNLGNQYCFSNVGKCYLKNHVSLHLQIHQSFEWSISKKYELKSVVNNVRKCFQIQSFEEMEDMILNEKSVPIYRIMNRKKTFGIKKPFFEKLLATDKIISYSKQKGLKIRPNKEKHVTLLHVVGVLALEEFDFRNIMPLISPSKGKSIKSGQTLIGPLWRITHYLLCEVPSELVMTWVEILNDLNFGSIVNLNKIASGNRILSLSRKVKYRSLCSNIDQRLNVEYCLPNECKSFIRGACNAKNCRKLHMCNRRKYCISFPKSEDIEDSKIKNELDSFITTLATKDEMSSDNQKVKDKKTTISRVKNKKATISQVKNKKTTIYGLCNHWNEYGYCTNKPCKWPHQCNSCLGSHPRRHCSKMEQVQNRQGKDKNMSKRKNSRGASPAHPISKRKKLENPTIHNRNNYLSVNDASPSWQHQLPSLPPPQPSTSDSYPHVSQGAYHSQMLNTSLSHRNISLTLSMNESNLSRVVENKLSRKDSIMAGVVKKVAKETFNKDTSCIVQHIKEEVENSGIPATMDNIGKLILDVSEIHKAQALSGNTSDHFGHGSSSSPMNEPSIGIGYEQPNWNQSHVWPSQQSTEYMYQNNAGVPSWQGHINEVSMSNPYGYNMPFNTDFFPHRKTVRSQQYLMKKKLNIGQSKKKNNSKGQSKKKNNSKDGSQKLKPYHRARFKKKNAK